MLPAKGYSFGIVVRHGRVRYALAIFMQQSCMVVFAKTGAGILHHFDIHGLIRANLSI